ncbi:type IV-A pilus assembly ATPase PilB [Pseudoalteromonas tunicata]|uniref:Type IV pilus biogenesis protein PilB n=1 Tax=Pseudoalteromonas tunicata D2 TaxID=87626 RepID=A4C8Z1_9GAMM|nr:type IV-A pilus assembly ATPase PilB [Pseudoalteromonas tunicata]ATC93558.1 type IV pilus assembly protein PilB [Pseudoalteromonas tunicata]AXT29400.1 type IV-A pilus assembly ATPase PilB [Pseudoalteromonas tunicata]EAR29056.1 type IV pilus biogenesis protein PilB [Pseudoalteromonas tunicata D2]
MLLNSPLIRKLSNIGVIELESFRGINKTDKTSIPEIICKESSLTSIELAKKTSSLFQVPFIDLNSYDFQSLPNEKILNEKLIKKHHVLPIAIKGKTIYLASADPTNFDAFEDYEFNTGMQTEVVVVNYEQLNLAIESLFDKQDGLELSDAQIAELEGVDGEQETNSKKSLSTDVNNKDDDAPIIVYINKILMDAIKKGASDLHFEPYEHTYRIRFRVDGVLHEIANPPVGLESRISARIKVMSHMDLAEKRKPQDGRIKLKITKKKSIDFRVSTLPTLWGEKIVMRILDSSSAMLGIDVLGYEPKQKDLYMNALAQPQGMILVTGPTGSGKTVSLYTGLNILNKPERNISTAEDPVEINLAGINQVQINIRADMTFANALRAFLRQDPDVVMVGEIRDLETAEIAIKAAQTGHLVLSTLHTNSAPETLTRLMNMGVPSYNIASSVSLIIAQRLARRLCSHCKEPEHIPTEELLKLGFTQTDLTDLTLFKAKGCEHCTEGYKGRVGIYEVMPITPNIAQIIMRGGNSLEIAEAATNEGVNNLRRSGLIKAASGMTSIIEINRVTSYQP